MIKYENCKLCGNNDFILLKKTAQYNFVKCSICGIFCVNPVPEISDEFYQDYDFNRRFIKYFDKYKNLYLNSLNKKIKRVEKLINKTLEADKMRFLDIGCGAGGYVFAARELGFEAYGIDLDEKSCSFAKSLGLNIKNGDFIKSNFPEDFFDLIMAKQVLEHIPEPKEFLLEINRIMKQDGILMLDVPNQDGLIPAIKIIFNLKQEEYGFVQPPRHLFAYGKETLIKLLKETGFKVMFCHSTMPGDATDYPLHRQSIFEKVIFKITAKINKGSVLVIYAQKK